MKDRKAAFRFGSRSAVRVADLAVLVRAPAPSELPRPLSALPAVPSRSPRRRAYGGPSEPESSG